MTVILIYQPFIFTWHLKMELYWRQNLLIIFFSYFKIQTYHFMYYVIHCGVTAFELNAKYRHHSILYNAIHEISKIKCIPKHMSH